MILDLLVVGLAITLEPIPLTAFIVGWMLSLVAVIAVTILITGNKPPRPDTGPSLAALAVKILIGVALVGVAERRRRRMGRPGPPRKQPKWQNGLDTMSPLLVTGLAPLTQPWGLVAAGVATIVEAELSSWQSYLALVLFCIVATGVYLVMEICALARPQRARALLGGIRSWIDAHTDHVIVAVSLGLGFWLVGDSIYVLVS